MAISPRRARQDTLINESAAQGLTVEQVAKELGYKEATVYRKIYLGTLKAQRPPEGVRIHEHENRELFEKRRALLRATQTPDASALA